MDGKELPFLFPQVPPHAEFHSLKPKRNKQKMKHIEIHIKNSS
jgi:hypothetical protein